MIMNCELKKNAGESCGQFKHSSEMTEKNSENLVRVINITVWTGAVQLADELRLS
jgi:hypothetical protein